MKKLIIALILLCATTAWGGSCYLTKPCLAFHSKQALEMCWATLTSSAPKQEKLNIMLKMINSGEAVRVNADGNKLPIIILEIPDVGGIAYKIRVYGGTIATWVPKYAVECY